MKSKFLLVFTTLIVAQSFCASGQRLVQKTFKSTLNAPFYHGVASGDPREHEVVLWTRISSNGNEDAEVTWEVSTTSDFTVITAYGNATATSANDFTIKVLAENLNSGQWYYYRFKAFDVYSPIGRTRTAPEGGVSNLRLAVMACANYQDGYFNAYRDVVNRNDVDAVLHLGDYIYEYGLTDFSPGSDTSRQHEPDYEILDLNDYRHRHAHYKLDPDLQELHRQFPFISIWDSESE
jgi:alkaline phosphatase D